MDYQLIKTPHFLESWNASFIKQIKIKLGQNETVICPVGLNIMYLMVWISPKCNISKWNALMKYFNDLGVKYKAQCYFNVGKWTPHEHPKDGLPQNY